MDRGKQEGEEVHRGGADKNEDGITGRDGSESVWCTERPPHGGRVEGRFCDNEWKGGRRVLLRRRARPQLT